MPNMQVQLYGITKDDIQTMFEETIKKYKVLPRWMYVDCSYLYNFDVSDFEYVRKFNLLCRYDINAVFQWHKWLERWLCDQTVTIADKQIKPIQISRSFDRVVNEGMEGAAMHFVGFGNMDPYKWGAIGSGIFSEVKPSDKALVNEVSRIDVTTDPNGGTLTRDGSTIYIIQNHPKSVEQGDMTELGAFDNEDSTIDKMLDHSKFINSVQHLINQDIPGGTIVIWQCSS